MSRCDLLMELLPALLDELLEERGSLVHDEFATLADEVGVDHVGDPFSAVPTLGIAGLSTNVISLHFML